MKKRRSGKFSKRKTWIIVCTAMLLLIVCTVSIKTAMKDNRPNMKSMEQAKVTRRDITATITGNAVVRPKDEYSITSLVTGEVIFSSFEEGDIIKEGDILYQVDASDIEKDIKNAELAVKRAQQNYNDALESKKEIDKSNKINLESAALSQEKAQQGYNDAVSSKEQQTVNNQKSLESAELAVSKAQQNYDELKKQIDNLNIKSDISGTVGELYVKQGDSVNVGMNIARIYDDSTLELRIPFNESDASNIAQGQEAEVTIIGEGETLKGIVSSVNTASEIRGANMRVREVTIKVASPGALSNSARATAKIGDIYCNDAGIFEYSNEKIVTAKSSGTIKEIIIDSGNSVTYDDVIATLENDTLNTQCDTALISLQDAKIALDKAKNNMADYSLNSQIENAKLSVQDADILYEKSLDALNGYAPDSQIESAKIALEEAKNNLEKMKSANDDYKITAPISGQIVTKNIKTGDKIDTMSVQEPMAVIYDMSTLEFKLMIDELDINKVSVGQKVKVTADALNGKEYFGVVSNVSINGEEANGVTSYPVSVSISQFDKDLLPGMNIDAEISVGESPNVLAIPKSAVTRDNIVYVVGEKEDAMDDAPEGYKSVSVVTGLNDGDYIEIVSGLSENDTVKIETLSSGFNFPMMGPGAMHPPGRGERR